MDKEIDIKPNIDNLSTEESIKYSIVEQNKNFVAFDILDNIKKEEKDSEDDFILNPKVIYCQKVKIEPLEDYEKSNLPNEIEHFKVNNEVFVNVKEEVFNILDNDSTFKPKISEINNSHSKKAPVNDLKHCSADKAKNLKKFSCDKCDYKSNLKGNLNIHLSIHSNVKKFACDQCDYKTNLKVNLNTHKLTHSNVQKFSCDQCSYKTNHKPSLKTHALIHSNASKFSCDKCDYKTYLKGTLNRHKLIHSNIKNFSCDQCDFKTTHKASLNVHKYIHSHVKKFSCDQCDYKTNQKGNLNRHKSFHSQVS